MQQEQEDNENITNIRHEGFQDTYDTLLLRLDPSPVLMKIKNSILRRRYDPETNMYIKIEGLKPKMTEQGVEDLSLELDARMSVDKVLSNLKEAKINDIVRQVGEVVLNFIFFKADDYEIEESQWDSILWIVTHNVDIFLRRALEGKTEDNLSKAMLFTDVTTRRAAAEQQSYDKEEGPIGFSLRGKRGRR
jgi:hypothetical protein